MLVTFASLQTDWGNRHWDFQMPAAIVRNSIRQDTGALIRLLKRHPAEQCASHHYPDLSSENITNEKAIAAFGLFDFKLITGPRLLFGAQAGMIHLGIGLDNRHFVFGNYITVENSRTFVTVKTIDGLTYVNL